MYSVVQGDAHVIDMNTYGRPYQRKKSCLLCWWNSPRILSRCKNSTMNYILFELVWLNLISTWFACIESWSLMTQLRIMTAKPILVIQSIAINLVNNHDLDRNNKIFWMPVHWSSLILIHDKSNFAVNIIHYDFDFQIFIYPSNGVLIKNIRRMMMIPR